MSEIKQRPLRSEVPEELTWDLTTIFPNDEAFEVAFNAVKNEIKPIKSLEGHLNESAEQLYHTVETLNQFFRRIEKLFVYASLKRDQDTSNDTYQAMIARVSQFATQANAATSWFTYEFLQISDERLNQMMATEPKLKLYQHNFAALQREKPHTLTPDKEAMLADMGDLAGASSRTFDVLSNSDLEFPNMKDEHGQEVQLSEGLYGKLIKSKNREVRRNAFQKLFGVYQQFSHTFASTLAGEVKVHNYTAKMRHYPSARDAAMESNEVPPVVYDNLIKTVHKYLPLLHRYMKFKKQVLGIDDFHMYDLYTPLVEQPPLHYDLASAKGESLRALKVMGEDYLKHLKEEFDHRWIDVVENKGKTSGAYSGGMYDTNPFILLNWQDELEDLFTLVHESGHSMHSYYTRHNQPFLYGDYPIFIAEIASTTNENLLTDYLLKHNPDQETQKYVLNHYLDGFKGTVYRQTQFAEFEQFIHEQDQKGEPLTAQVISTFYKELNQKYYGPDVISDDEIAFEWARIPHFYMNYYVYQYATGFAAATTLSKGILQNNAHQLDKYLDFLKAGSSDYPINVMKKAGVDMTQVNYLETAFKTFEQRLDQFEKLY